jgi:hypothetical protein
MMQILSIAISIIALVVSLGNLYLQHFRRVQRGTANVLWATWRYDTKGNLSVEIDIAISNQGNRPFVISRIWLLSELRGNNRTYYESDRLTQSNPLKVESSSIEHVHLIFSLGKVSSNLGQSVSSANRTFDILIYATDDLGKEHYSQGSILKLKFEDNKIMESETIKLNLNIFEKKNSIVNKAEAKSAENLGETKSKL